MDARIDVVDDEGGSDAADELVRRRARPVAQVDYWYSPLIDQFGKNIHSMPPPIV